MSRRSGPAWLAAVVLAAHVAVLSWAAAQLPARAGGSGAAPLSHRWLLARALASPDGAKEVEPSTGRAVGAAGAASPSRAGTSPSPPAPPPPTSFAEPVEAAVADAATTEVSTRFYAYDEVDTAAEPQADWTLDVQTLDALALSRIVVTLWVDERGAVLRCTVDEPSRLTPAQRDVLAEHIALTPLRPATRGGIAVASKRRIELTTAGG